MPAPSALFHAFLRPSILQILRATGYHSTSPAVLDAMTDLAARYMSLLCEKTAEHATHRTGDAGDFSLPEIRLALQDAGALLPERLLVEEQWTGTEDLRGVEEFVKWFSGQRMKEIMDFARGDGEGDETDYLNGG
jgi:transcription initiation factor TFIID subunit 3